MTKIETLQELGKGGFFRFWISPYQRAVLMYMLETEEAQHFIDTLTTLKARIDGMPVTYATEGVDVPNKIAHLHYFRGNIDAWIVEKDKGDPSDQNPGIQIQAFGSCCMTGEGISGAELGYINIHELLLNDVEMDLYWNPKPVGEIK